MEWIDEEPEVFDDMVSFVTDVEFLDGMRDDPEFKLFDADGRRLYFDVWALDIMRVSFIPDTGLVAEERGTGNRLFWAGCYVLLVAFGFWLGGGGRRSLFAFRTGWVKSLGGRLGACCE